MPCVETTRQYCGAEFIRYGGQMDARLAMVIPSVILFTGAGYIAGTVTADGVPASRPVRLYDRASGHLVGMTTSDDDGAYRFDGINSERQYLVVAIDDTDTFNAAPADLIEPATE